MLRRSKIYLTFVLLILIAGFSLCHYLFSIYEVTYKITPDKLYADNTSTLVIEVIPLNSFGWRAPFRKAPAEFMINEGQNLVEIISNNQSIGVLKLKAKEKSGKISVTIKSKYSLFPSTIEIFIEPNFV